MALAVGSVVAALLAVYLDGGHLSLTLLTSTAAI